MKPVLLSATAFVMLVIVATGQIVYIENNDPTTGTANTIPWAQTAGYTSLHVYTAAQLLGAGVPAGAILQDIALAPASLTNGGVYNAPQARLEVGHLVVNPPVPGNWTGHLDSPAIIHSLASGPFTFTYTLNAWSSLPGGGGGFSWDGVRDIGIFYTTGPGVTGGFNCHRTATNLRHGVNVFNATVETPTTNGLFAMKVRLTFVSPGYQANQPAATLYVGSSPASSPPDVRTVCVNQPITITMSTTTGTGFPWDLAYHPGQATAAAYTTTGGQYVNVNWNDPQFRLLNGGFRAGGHPGGPLVMPLVSGLAQTLSGQYVQMDPTQVDGFALSAVTTLNFAQGGTTQTLTLTDDSTQAINITQPPFCAPAGIPFYGASHSILYVNSNFNVTFGAGDLSYSPSAPTFHSGSPRVGFWTDLNPALGGTIQVSQPAGVPIIDVTWTNVPEFGAATGAPGNSGHISFDILGGLVFLDSMVFNVSLSGQFQIVGMSPGGGAQDPGSVNFLSLLGGPMQPGPGGNGSIYEISGGAGQAVPVAGIYQILFAPTGSGNYTFQVY